MLVQFRSNHWLHPSQQTHTPSISAYTSPHFGQTVSSASEELPLLVSCSSTNWRTRLEVFLLDTVSFLTASLALRSLTNCFSSLSFLFFDCFSILSLFLCSFTSDFSSLSSFSVLSQPSWLLFPFLSFSFLKLLQLQFFQTSSSGFHTGRRGGGRAGISSPQKSWNWVWLLMFYHRY